MNPTWVSPCGRATLYLGDCLAVLPALAAGSVDACVMDPPYSSGTRREGSKGVRKAMLRAVEDEDWFPSDCLTTEGFWWLIHAAAVQIKRCMGAGSHLLSFIDWRMWSHISGAIESADLRRVGMLVWDKTYFGMGSCFRNQHELILHCTNGMGREPSRRDVGNVLRFAPVRDGDHYTEKPLDLLEALLSVTTREGDLVGDFFMGSGTTGVAAIKTGRRFVGIEIEPRYFAIAKRRIQRAIEDYALFQQPPEPHKQLELMGATQ